MEPTSTASIKVARGLLAGLFALSLYRAVTQAVTPAEAWNYNLYIAPEWTQALTGFDMNNHFLNTLLVRIVATRLHITELWLRLPSLLAGLLYLTAAWRLARRFGNGPVFLATLSLLTLHPAVIDALSEARGYGMGLACWCWGLELLIQSSEPDSRVNLNLAGICLGLSVAAAPVFLAPAVSLVLVFAYWRRGHGVPVAAWAFLTAFLLLVIPVNHAEWKGLAVGATSLRQTINEFSALTFGTSSPVLAAAARVAVALVAVVSALSAARFWRRGEPLLVLTAGTASLSLLLLILAHSWKQIPFPQAGFVYIVPVLCLTVTAILLKLHNSGARIALYVVAALFVTRYLTELPVGSYASGTAVRGGRELAKTLRLAGSNRPVRIATNPVTAPILEFYKTRYRKANWQIVPQKPDEPSDFYVVTPADAAPSGPFRIRYHDPGFILFERF